MMTALCSAQTMCLGVLATDGGFMRNIDGTEEAGWAAANAGADAGADADGNGNGFSRRSRGYGQAD